MKKKVLMLASVASMIDQFNLPNIRLLQDMGYEVHVACNFKEGNTCDGRRLEAFQKELESMHVIWRQWDCPRSIRPIVKCCRAYQQLWELTGRYHYEWMHCHSPIGGALARLTAHRRKIRVVYTAHGFHFYKKAPWKNWLLYYPVEMLAAYWTDVLVTVNLEDYRFAKRNLKAGKIYYIPGVGIDTHRYQTSIDIEMKRAAFCQRYQIPEDARILLSVGELNRRKNHQAVIAALAGLSGRDIYYVICGQGALKNELMCQAEALGVAEHVRFLGFQEDMVGIYQIADIFVFPSLQEGMPVALMEAMAAGLPCVASDIRGNRELIDDSIRDSVRKDHTRLMYGRKRQEHVSGNLKQENGKIVTVQEKQGGVRVSLGQPEQLLAALELLLGDEQRRREYGLHNQNKIRGYDLAVVQKRMQRIYAEMEPDIRISVLIAIYNPDFIWLEELLVSIVQQTFPAYEVILADDGSMLTSFQDIQNIVSKNMNGQEQVFLYRSNRNEGSDRTFEKLVSMAKGNYIAFCDQDDIWEKEKLEMLAEAVKKEHAVLAYSDMSVIDEDGKQIYRSLRKMRKWLRYVHGANVTAKVLSDNCIAGCSMLVETALVRKAVPFCEDAYCDQWIAAFVSAYGRVAFVDRPLVRYRRHDANQTGFLHKIRSKQDYYAKRALPMYRIVREIRSRGIHFRQKEEIAAFAVARRDKNIRQIWKYRKFNKKYAYFDLLMICLPDALADGFLRILHRKQKKRFSRHRKEE